MSSKNKIIKLRGGKELCIATTILALFSISFLILLLISAIKTNSNDGLSNDNKVDKNSLSLGFVAVVFGLLYIPLTIFCWKVSKGFSKAGGGKMVCRLSKYAFWFSILAILAILIAFCIFTFAFFMTVASLGTILTKPDFWRNSMKWFSIFLYICFGSVVFSSICTIPCCIISWCKYWNFKAPKTTENKE